MAQYLYFNGTLSERQYNFRSNHSCISWLIDALKELGLTADNNISSFLVLHNHSKAFDTVNHTTLCQKLKHMCIIRILLLW